MHWIDLRKHSFYGLLIGGALRGIQSGLLATSLTLGLLLVAQAAQPSRDKAQSQASQTIDRLQTLSAQAQENSDWIAAEDYLLRAQYQLHREYGVTTPKQQPIVNSLATLSIQSENYQKANQLFEFNHFVSQKTAAPADLQTANTALARWYLQSGQYARAATLLEPSEADDFSGTAFVPERALLRLNVARFTRQCCTAKEIMETTQQAQNAGLSQDALRLFLQAAAELLIISGRPMDAAAYLQSAEMTPNKPPKIIAGKRRIVQRDPNRDLNQMERRKIEQLLYARGMSTDPFQANTLWKSGPDTVTVRSSGEFLPIERPEQSEVGSQRQFHTLIGHPLRFRKTDLRQILPAKYWKKTTLDNLEIRMTFTITTQGRIRNLKFDAAYDREVRELMRDTLKSIRFLPELKDGMLVTRENFKLVQSFQSQGEA